MDNRIGTTPVLETKLDPTTRQCENSSWIPSVSSRRACTSMDFRFDLAGILGEPDLNYNAPSDPASTVLQDIIDHPVMKENNIRIISEPWTAAGSGPVLVDFQPQQTILRLRGVNGMLTIETGGVLLSTTATGKVVRGVLMPSLS